MRIEAYAVDIPRLVEFLEKPSGYLLQYVVDHAPDTEQAMVYWHDPHGGRVYARPGHGVYRLVRGGDKQMLPDVAHSADPFMARSGREYLHEHDSRSLNAVFRSLSLCSGTGFIKVVTEGYRRWWIGSLIDFTDRSQILTPQDYDRFVMLWQRVLHGCACDVWLPLCEFDLRSLDFPILPADDLGHSMGAWSEEEAYFQVDCLKRILDTGPRFRVPPQRVSRADESDDEWNEWVHTMIGHFLRIEDTQDYQQLAVVSFISS